MRTLLINSCPQYDQTIKYHEPLGIGYIASFLTHHGFSADVFDLNVIKSREFDEIAASIVATGYDVVGISATQATGWGAYQIGERLQAAAPEIFLCLGGYLPSVGPKHILEKFRFFDCFVFGEGEETFLEVLRCLAKGEPWRDLQGVGYFLEGGLVRNELRPQIRDLSDLPFPRRTMAQQGALVVDPQRRMDNLASVISSRGCFGNCAFCSIQSFRKTLGRPHWRPRDPTDVAEEIAHLQHTRGVDHILFEDDDFFGGRGQRYQERACRIADEIMARNLNIKFRIFTRASNVASATMRHLVTAGLTKVFVGFENFDPEALIALGKPCTVEDNIAAIEILSDLEIVCEPGLIFTAPGISFESYKTNLEFLRANRDKLVVDSDVLFWDIDLIHGSPMYNAAPRQQEATIEQPLCRVLYRCPRLHQMQRCKQFLRLVLKRFRDFRGPLPFGSEVQWMHPSTRHRNLHDRIVDSFEYGFLELSLEVLQSGWELIDAGEYDTESQTALSRYLYHGLMNLVAEHGR